MSTNNDWILLEQIEIKIQDLTDKIENLDECEIKKLSIILPNKQRLPLALLCYDKIKYSSYIGYKSIYVKTQTLKSEKVDFAKTVLEMLIGFHNNGRRDLNGKYRLIRDFISRLKTKVFPLTINSAREVLKKFIDELREENRKFVPSNRDTGEPGRGLSSAYCSNRQNLAIELLEKHLKVSHSELTAGINLIHQGRKSPSKTLPVSETELAREFNFYTTLFRELSCVILNNELLPKKLELIEGDFWVMPYSTWAIPNESSPKKRHLPYLNYNDGTFYTPNELLSKYNSSMLSSSKKRNKVLRSWEHNNAEFSSVRQQLIIAALKAYYLHFLILTAMNDAPAAGLIFDDSYSTAKSKQNFVTVKWRAAGKKVNFDIQSEFLNDFKTYLKLREYVLNKLGESNFKYLFIGSIKLGLNHLRLNGSASAIIRKSFEKVAPFSLNGNRKLRLTKGLWIRKHFGVTISGYVLQHSATTSMTSYSGNDPATASIELTNYFDQINDIHLKRDNSIPTETGRCTVQLAPDFIEQTPEMLKVCGKGCLYCRNFRVHPDQEDLHKLYSCLFVIRQLQSLARNKAHWEEIYKPLEIRIESLVDSMVLRDEKNLLKVKQQVILLVFQDQVLTKYWEMKLQLLAELGVL